ncbi:uncharacterized protein BDR25DRAFT_260921 [Lindgomyces ingoldianus]|uniref:Uncharacterized protein n=1 Tax=Lindgomyces ingoldianus TaxID=673940 RepID=A0ACB6QZ95_9PLEO|nr:uncharacterized protein BDR25DRAFT_260921 [Lindgomyces ingoldianus]KAF2471395.1 hypothetical protein BDR25DRAFT_260921 [Lindgomyces ingoldianus]
MFSWLTLLSLCAWCFHSHDAHHERAMHSLGGREGSQSLAFSTSWQVLGPFQIGTREATWGADPLEYLGGFRALQYDPGAQFRSSLPTNGTARWSVVVATQTSGNSSSSSASLSISYDNVDWNFLKVVYGWAAVQYQAWARGEITVSADDNQHVILYTDSILEYWVDDVHYFGGDFFTYRRAPPVLHLTPGTHKIDLRLVRDVRAMGGVLDPTIDVVVEAQRVSGTLELAKPGILMSDVVDGKLASLIGSVALRNSGEDDIEIVDVQSSDVRSPVNTTNLGGKSRLVVVAGQTRPFAFNISLPTHNTSSVRFSITYKTTAGGDQLSTLLVSQNLTRRSIYDPHKITYLHPGSMASYAMLRPPAENAACSEGPNSTLPVLLQLHGAGVEADSDQVAHALDPVPDLCAWVIFPTGVTSWSGDDWHNWGFADVEAAVNSIPSWIDAVAWRGPGVDVNTWVVSGHSNGGQGSWYALTHRPDRIVAASPISGYSSIQKYVPYELWQPMDPRRTAIISASLNSYRHEMLMENAKGIPVLQQHGEKDDNVPTYHSRFLRQLLFQVGTNSNYYELPGKGHYYDGVMTTDQLKSFYREQTRSDKTTHTDPQEFSIVVGDPGDMGSKGGILVTHLGDPGQYGRVDVKYDSTLKSYTIKTSNILGLKLDERYMQHEGIGIDGQDIATSEGSNTKRGFLELSHSLEGSWKIGPLYQSNASTQHRHGRQLGSMTAILRSSGPLTIRHQAAETAHIALQVSRNLHQYFSADSKIISTGSWDDSPPGNLISIAIGGDAPPIVQPDFPIQVGTTSVSVRDSNGRWRRFGEGEGAHLGAAFLQPPALLDERLELVLWGSDVEMVAQVARLVPMLTGVGQPDFVVLGDSARWRGVEGALSLGFFDYSWNVTPSSVV